MFITKKRILFTLIFSLLTISFPSANEVSASPTHRTDIQNSSIEEPSDTLSNSTTTIETQESMTKEQTNPSDIRYSTNDSVDPGLLRSDITKQANEKLQVLKEQLEQAKGIGIYIEDSLTITIDGHIHLDYTLPDQSIVSYDGILSFEKPSYQNFPSTKTELAQQSLTITRERESLDKKFYETISTRWHFLGEKSISGEEPTEISIDQVDNTWEYPLSISLILTVDVPPLIVDAPRGTSKENPILVEKGSTISDDPKDYFRVVSSGYEATIEWHVRPDFTKENEFTAELGIRDKFDQYWTVNGQSSVPIYFKVVDKVSGYLTSLTPEISYSDIQLDNGTKGIRVSNKLDADANTQFYSVPAQLNYLRFSFPGEFSLLTESVTLEAIIKSTNQVIQIGQEEYSITAAGNSFSLTNLSKKIEMFYAQEEIIIHYDLKKMTKLTREAYCSFETNYSPQNSETNTAKTLVKIQEPDGLLTLTVPEYLDFGLIEIGQEAQATLPTIAPKSLNITDNRAQKSSLKLLIDLSSPLKNINDDTPLAGGLFLEDIEPNSFNQYVFYEGKTTEHEDNFFDLTDQLIEQLQLKVPDNEQSGKYEGTIKWTLVSGEP